MRRISRCSIAGAEGASRPSRPTASIARASSVDGTPMSGFTRRAMLAGVQGYIAFLRGQRVTYFGRAGDQHTEWFPGAGPNDASTS